MKINFDGAMFKNEALVGLGVIIQNGKGLAMAAVGSRFLDRAHYNEFVENESKSWALMRRRLVLEVKNTQNRTTQRPKEKGRLARGRELPTPLTS